MVIKEVMTALFDANDALDNPLVRRHNISTFLTVPPGATFSDDGVPTPFVLVSVRNPTGSLASGEQRQRFVRNAYDAIMRNVSGPIDDDRVYINLFYGAGMWGIGPVAYNDEALAVWFGKSTRENPGF